MVNSLLLYNFYTLHIFLFHKLAGEGDEGRVDVVGCFSASLCKLHSFWSGIVAGLLCRNTSERKDLKFSQTSVPFFLQIILISDQEQLHILLGIALYFIDPKLIDILERSLVCQIIDHHNSVGSLSQNHQQIPLPCSTHW